MAKETHLAWLKHKGNIIKKGSHQHDAAFISLVKDNLKPLKSLIWFRLSK